MIKQKKGAFELSVTTIIVIVIGVVLLTLGLIFVRTVFFKVQALSIDAFDQADAEISNLGSVQGLLTISPGTIQLDQGSAKDVKVIIANFESTEIRIRAITSSPDEDMSCVFADTKGEESKPLTIKSGQQAALKLIADQDDNGNLGTKVCNVELLDAPEEARDSLVITVVKPRGFFG